MIIINKFVIINNMEEPCAKRQCISHDNNINIIMERLGDLENLLSKYLGDSTSTDTLYKQIKKLSEAIPAIVVIGDQSAGKSSGLNKLFNLNGDFSLKTDDLLGTKCLVEIIASKETKHNTYMVTNLNTNQIDYFNSMLEAQKYIDKISEDHGGIIVPYKITIKVYHDGYLKICDIPGFRSDTMGSNIINYYIENYIRNKPEAIVLHYRKATDDPSTLNSYQYLKTIRNPVINIMTNVDLMMHGNEINRLLSYIGKENIYLTSKDVTDDTLQNIFGEYIEKKYIGTNALLAHTMNVLQQNTQKQVPIISNCVSCVLHAINDRFKVINRTKPDTRDELYRYKMNTTTKIMDSFDKSETSKEIRKLYDEQFTSQEINKLADQVSSINSIKDELQKGYKNSIKGAEGWENIVRTEIGKLCDNVKPMVADCSIYYKQLVYNELYKIISETSTPFTIKIIKHLNNKIDNQIEIFYNNIIKEIYDELDKIKALPYVENISDSEYTKYDVYKAKKYREIIESTKMIPGLTNEQIDNYVAKIMHIQQQTSQYDEKAYNARNQIIKIWKQKSQKIHEDYVCSVNKHCDAFKDILIKEVSNLLPDDLYEPEDITKERIALLEIEKQCNLINMN